MNNNMLEMVLVTLKSYCDKPEVTVNGVGYVRADIVNEVLDNIIEELTNNDKKNQDEN